MAERQQRRRSSKAAGLAPKRGKAKSLPRPAPPKAAKPPSPTRGAQALVNALAALLLAHEARPAGAAVTEVLGVLHVLLAMIERYIDNPGGLRLAVEGDRIELRPAEASAAPSVATAPAAAPSSGSSSTTPSAPAPTHEQQRAQAAIDADLAAKELAMTARELEHLGQHEPRAAQLAAGLRSLLAPPTLALTPTQKRLVVDLFETLRHQGHLVDALAVARDEAADLRRKWIDGAGREEIRRALNEVDSCIEHARHLTWKVGDGLNMSAGHITGDASPDGASPDGALGQAVALAMLLRAADWHGDSDEDRRIMRARGAWDSSE